MFFRKDLIKWEGSRYADPGIKSLPAGYCGYREAFGWAGDGHTGVRLDVKTLYLPYGRYGREGVNPFPTLLYLGRVGSGEAQTEACMALPGRPIWLPVAPIIATN